MSRRRTTPLAAAPEEAGPEAAPLAPPELALDPPAPYEPTLQPASADGLGVVRRDGRFADGVRRLRVGGTSRHLDERILLVVAGTIAPLGLIAVLLGWWGASHTPYVFEQVPYLISGGLLGLGLLFLGSFFYFAHWMTQLVREHRVQSQAVVEALQRLHDQLAQGSGVGTTAGAVVNGSDARLEALVATERGTMAHRLSCVVVAGKADLRAVGVEDGLAPCKLCEPYAPGGDLGFQS
jgi:hypothetical protein